MFDQQSLIWQFCEESIFQKLRKFFRNVWLVIKFFYYIYSLSFKRTYLLSISRRWTVDNNLKDFGIAFEHFYYFVIKIWFLKQNFFLSLWCRRGLLQLWAWAWFSKRLQTWLISHILVHYEKNGSVKIYVKLKVQLLAACTFQSRFFRVATW